MSTSHDDRGVVNAQVSNMDVDDSAWEGVEDNTEDPEETRVIFCALDSFL